MSQTDLFISKLKSVGATVKTINSHSELVQEVHRYSAENQIKSTITVTEDEAFNDLDLDKMDVDSALELQSMILSVTFAWMGIEETGTLVILSSSYSPNSLNFLPDHHLIVLNQESIVKSMNDVWNQLRKEQKDMPKVINMVTGPSCSADIDTDIEAHGPKYLHVVLLNESL